MKAIKSSNNISKVLFLIICASFCLGNNFQNSSNEKIIESVILYEDHKAASINKRVKEKLTHIAISYVGDDNKTNTDNRIYKTTLPVLNFPELECETYAGQSHG